MATMPTKTMIMPKTIFEIVLGSQLVCGPLFWGRFGSVLALLSRIYMMTSRQDISRSAAEM
jgi:hypothetical protein